MPLFPPQDYRKTDQTHRRGLAANRPAAADVLPGTLYHSTDVDEVYRSNGTAWDLYAVSAGGGGGGGYPPQLGHASL
jgi:hypothetical protein